MNVKNPTTSLLNKVKDMIDGAIKVLPKSIIVRVVKVNKNTVDVVNVDLKLTTQAIIKNVPIMRSIYGRYPIKIGDIGICLTVDFGVEPLLKNSKIPKIALQRNADGGGYFFFPFASLDNDLVSSDTMANELYSLDGQTQLIIDNKKTELSDRFNNDILVDSKGIAITDCNKNEIVIDSKGLKITDCNKNEVVIDSKGLKITDCNKNEVELGSSGIVIKDSNNNKIETSSTSVIIKNASSQVELGASGVNINNGALEIMP